MRRIHDASIVGKHSSVLPLDLSATHIYTLIFICVIYGNFFVFTHAHKHVHSHTNTYTHTQTRTLTHKHVHLHTHTHTHTQTRTLTQNTYAPTQTRTLTHKHVHSHTNTYTHAERQTHIQGSIITYIYTYREEALCTYSIDCMGVYASRDKVYYTGGI